MLYPEHDRIRIKCRLANPPCTTKDLISRDHRLRKLTGLLLFCELGPDAALLLGKRRNRLGRGFVSVCAVASVLVVH